MAVFLAAASLIVIAGGGREQELVLFYAVAVFVSFLFGLLAMSVFSWRDRRWGSLAVNVVSVGAVVLTLAVNLRRGYPIASLVAAAAVAAVLWYLWVRSGRPSGVSETERRAEEALAS